MHIIEQLVVNFRVSSALSCLVLVHRILFRLLEFQIKEYVMSSSFFLHARGMGNSVLCFKVEYLFIGEGTQVRDLTCLLKNNYIFIFQVGWSLFCKLIEVCPATLRNIAPQDVGKDWEVLGVHQ